MLNNVEMSAQEAAWYLLRQAMSETSTAVIYIPTVWPIERERVRRSCKELDELGVGFDSTDIWKENYFDKYEGRPKELENVTLAQFVSWYYKPSKGCPYVKRGKKAVIRYRNYDIGKELNEFKREMVTLHIPFRNEHDEILADMKFVSIYDANENVIGERRKEFEADVDCEKTIKLCRELADENPSAEPVANFLPEVNPYDQLLTNAVNDDIRLATLNKLGPVAKRRENVMKNEDFLTLMRTANEKQTELVLHIIHHLSVSDRTPLQLFFTGPAGCGKTFLIKLIMEIYNRFSETDGFCNSYIACASTGKAAVAIGGTTVHTAFKITLSKLLPLSIEVVYQYRALFRYIKVIIIDEISMIGAELLNQIDARLKQITGNYDHDFGGLDVIFIGDLRQLPPVRSTAIYKQQKQKIFGPMLWRGLKYFRLEEVMRQANKVFSTILTKIGNGELLDDKELKLIESRFFKQAEIDKICPTGIRLFNTNAAVQRFNNKLLNESEQKTISIAKDIFIGYDTKEQEAFARQRVHKMSVVETNGLPYEIVFVIGFHYMLTTNVDVSDGLANGAVGKLVHLDVDENGEVTAAWLRFLSPPGTGQKIRCKLLRRRSIEMPNNGVPIFRRNVTISLNAKKTTHIKRNQLPLVCACASTIHKSQGSTYPEIVYEYAKTHSQSLLYVAVSRVTDLNGLHMVTENDENVFYHGRSVPNGMDDLQREFERLEKNKLFTIKDDLLNFITSQQSLIIYILNCQSFQAHVPDLEKCEILRQSHIALLTETWASETSSFSSFQIISSYKRNVTAGGVSIYHNKNDTNNSMISQKKPLTFPIGDICTARYITNDGHSVTLAAVYINVNQQINNIIHHIRDFLSTSFQKDEKLIVAGDFNVDMTKEIGKPLITFLQSEFDLQITPTSPTTRAGTTIDAIFSRGLNIDCKTYVSYFSYHKPIIAKTNIQNSH